MFGKAFSKTLSKTSGKSLSKTINHRRAVFTVVLGCAAVFVQTTPGQTTPAQPVTAASSSLVALELPVTMRQKVAAGKTTAGTKVQAKLAVATLVDGVVIPRDALLSGEVTESVAKAPTSPSRLAIRMDSAQWKNGAAPIVLSLTPKLYLTAWYYPVAMVTNQDSSSDLPDAVNHPRPLSGTGAYPGPRNPTAPPFPAPDSGRDQDTGLAPPSNISQHRVLMKNVESTRDGEGAVILTSKQSDIKLDKATIYVLATADRLPAK
jgi:hypothetical protein